MKQKFFFLTMLLWSIYSFGQNFTVDGIKYNVLTASTVEVIAKNPSYTGNVTIPASVTNSATTYSVTSIGMGAFASCSGLTSVTIPNSVTSISNFAFHFCIGLTSVTIPNSVTSIGYAAFRNCTSLTSVTIPNSVTAIGNDAFYSCTGLTSVTIPNSVTSIGEYTFAYCTGLTSVTIPDSVTAIGRAAFTHCSGLTSVTIPNSVTSISNFAFYFCIGLTSVTIPNSVTAIGESAFDSCSHLTSVTIPNSVTAIGESAFDSCSHLTSVTIPNSVTSIGNSAFAYCSGLTSVTVAWATPLTINSNVFQGLTLANVILHVPAGTEALYEAAAVWTDFNITTSGIVQTFTVGGIKYNILTASTVEVIANSPIYTGSVTIPATVTYGATTYSVTAIGNDAFRDCTGLTSVTIPNSVTQIDDYAFANCSGLTSVTVAWATPLTINSNVFQNVTLANVILYVPAGTEALYEAAAIWTDFNITTSGIVQTFTVGGIKYNILTASTVEVIANSPIYTGSVTIPATVTNGATTYSVTAIGNNAFKNCTSLTSVTIPNSVTAIGEYTFDHCSGLTSVTIPNSVTSIGNFAFEHCSGLTSVTIPNSVISISASTFAYCFGLTSVTIPNSVTAIGNNAFKNCTGLTSVTIPNSITSIGNFAFAYCSGLTSVTIPNSVTAIGNYAFYKCLSLTSVTIPNSVTSIGDHAFYGCSGLTSVTIPNSVISIGIHAFSRCTGLTSVTIPNSVTAIGYATFAYCSGLTSVTIPNSVTSIGDYAFRNCTGLTSVTVVWATPLTINSNVFQGLTLANVILYVPAGTAALYEAVAVWTNFNITTLGIGQTFTENGIKYNILTASTIEVIANSPIYTGSVTIPATVTNRATTYSVTAIGNDAFRDCTGLTSVTIPNSVTQIDDYAFANCSGLTSVTVAWATPLTINSNVFQNVTLANVILYVPAGTEASYEATAVWTDFNITTLGITDMQKETTAIQVYPNPTTAIITLKNSEDINQVQVFSIEGKLLKTEKINTQNATLDLSDLPKGVYLLQTNRGSSKVVKE